MSKKHFVAIAAAVKSQYAAAGQINDQVCRGQALMTLDAATKALADVFSDANPRFDRAHFLAACGIV